MRDDVDTPEDMKKIPTKLSDYKKYKSTAIQSTQTLWYYKERMSSDQEQQAGIYIYKKEKDSKAILHVDFNSRSNIKGEWPSLIINFPHQRRFNLRPLLLL